MPTNKTEYVKRARLSLIFLWIGAFILLFIMVYNWLSGANSTNGKSIFLQPKHIFVDQLLLSSQELQLGEGTTLINISLNEDDSQLNEKKEIKAVTPKTEIERKLIYSKMLKTKIKRMTSEPEKSDVVVKPLPQ